MTQFDRFGGFNQF